MEKRGEWEKRILLEIVWKGGHDDDDDDDDHQHHHWHLQTLLLYPPSLSLQKLLPFPLSSLALQKLLLFHYSLSLTKAFLLCFAAFTPSLPTNTPADCILHAQLLLQYNFWALKS